MHPIERHRRIKGWTQAELAARVGVVQNTVQGWEDGSMPRARRIPALAAALGLEPAALLDQLEAWRPTEAPDELTPREVRLLEMRYAVHGGRPLSLAQIGREFGVTRQRTGQLEARAVEKVNRMQEALAAGRPLSPEALRQLALLGQPIPPSTSGAAGATRRPPPAPPGVDGAYRRPGHTDRSA